MVASMELVASILSGEGNLFEMTPRSMHAFLVSTVCHIDHLPGRPFFSPAVST